MSFPASTVTPPTGLAPFQANFNNLTFGGVNPLNPYAAVKWDGLDLPALRSGDAPRSRDHGSFVGLNVFGPRTITADLIVGSTSGNVNFHTAKAALVAALMPNPDTESPLYIQTDGGLLVCEARCTKASFSVDINRMAPVAGGQQGGLPVAIQWVASDPRFYETPTHSTTIAVGASQTLTHAGDIEMRPVIVVTGPCTNPSIQNLTIPGNPVLSFFGTVASGATLTVDLDMHSVLLTSGGVTAVAANMLLTASTWWNLVPGTNTIHFASAGGGSLNVQWASAYGTAA